MRSTGIRAVATLVGLVVAGVAAPATAMDLAAARAERLDNGLSVLLLEDHAFPVVSVQVLYRVGSRSETVGRTGIAHFLEHMAFRDTQAFPGTEVVSRIYAVGGEWHGYTWLDQTTYFSTVPADQLDLLLRIEAERMSGLKIQASDVEAERGAVLAEMHGYENDPGSRLADAVRAVAFEQHPYRYNVVGWESDVQALTHDDLVDFYRRYYRPGAAVLAVVGDFAAEPTMNRIRRLFSASGRGPLGAPVRTVEPPQDGVRRVEVPDRGRPRFEIAYRAPAVRDPDYPALLLIQAMLAGSRGVNFLRADAAVPAGHGSRLSGAADEIGVQLLATQDPYLLRIVGVAPDNTEPAQVEAGIERRLSVLRDAPPAGPELEAARRAVRRELVFDVQTTEDAAHQLAFFEGLGARDVLASLPERVARVSPAAIQQAARRWLQPNQRTIGWTVAGEPAPATTPLMARREALPPTPPARTAPATPRQARPPQTFQLSSGLPVLARRVQGAETGNVRLLVEGTGWEFDGPASEDDPVLGFTSLEQPFLKTEMWQAIEALKARLATARPRTATPAPPDDPMRRLRFELRRAVGLASGPVPAEDARPRLAALAISSDVDPLRARPALEGSFGRLPRSTPGHAAPLAVADRTPSIRLPEQPQAALGYAVPAPAPSATDALAWQALLYVFAHGYEGRLGRLAISQRGLLYYVDARYEHDGQHGLVSLEMGVDPDKLGPLRVLFFDELSRLSREPPSEAEVDEARRYLIGRRSTAAQSPEELTASLVADWLGRGQLESAEQFAERAGRLTRDDVVRVLPAFSAGATVTVDVRP